MDRNEEYPRRAFLKRSATVGAGIAGALAGETLAQAADKKDAKKPPAKAKPEQRNAKPGVVYKRLGRTNFMVSTVSFGGVGLKEPMLPIFDAAVGGGMNFAMIHAGGSAAAAGKWLKKPGNRERIFLGLRSTPSQLDSVLKVLNTDRVDLLMVTGHNVDAASNEKVRKDFEAAKKAGKARYLCLVFHSNVPAVFKAGVQAGWYDVLLPTYNFASRKDLKPMIAEAKAKDLGLLTMKSMRALPRGTSFVSAAKRFVADGIASVVKSFKDPKQLAEYWQAAQADDKTPPAKAAAVDLTGQCTLCGACGECPEGVAIQDVLRTHQYYAKDLGWLAEARRQYSAIPPEATPEVCTGCGQCERLCPQGLPIAALLAEAHAELA